MMAPPTHGQPSLVSSSTTQYPEQTHTMYGTSDPACTWLYKDVAVISAGLSLFLINGFFVTVSPGPMPQQYAHPSATLHPHPQHPQPSATPTGQGQQGGPPQHGGPPSHPAASPVQHQQHQQAAAGQYRCLDCGLDICQWNAGVLYLIILFLFACCSSSSPGPPPGQPASSAADVLSSGPYTPLYDPRPQPSVSPGIIPLCPADSLYPPTASAA